MEWTSDNWQEISAEKEIQDWEYANVISVKEFRDNKVGKNLITLKTFIAQVEDEPVESEDPSEIETETVLVPATWWDYIKVDLKNSRNPIRFLIRDNRINFHEIVTQTIVKKTYHTFRNCPHLLRDDIEKHITFMEGCTQHA